VLLFGVGFSVMVLLTSCNTLVQTVVADEMRGRVMSLYAAAFMGLNPLGSLAAGALAERVGVQTTLLIGGLACPAAAPLLSVRWRRPLRAAVREAAEASAKRR